VNEAAEAGWWVGGCGTAQQLAEKCDKTRKSFLQGLKPVGSKQFKSELKLRPPKEKTFPADCGRMFPQGLKPIDRGGFMSELKLRPP